MILASIMRILSSCFMRPGSQAYAEENGSYGIATLCKKHLSIEGDRVRFSFRGKSGQRQTAELRDPQLARILRRLKKAPGPRLFKYRNERGELIEVRRRYINDYIKEVMGTRFSAKDFRTWAGTLLCASALARGGVQPNQSERTLKRQVLSAVREAAEVLGNTAAVCRSSYIEPSILNSFRHGRVVDNYFRDTQEVIAYRGRDLHPCERSLLTLLKTERQTREAAARKAA
jgi:DNA topoisomerase-1